MTDEERTMFTQAAIDLGLEEGLSMILARVSEIAREHAEELRTCRAPAADQTLRLRRSTNPRRTEQ